MSGIRRLEARWAARQAARGQHAQPEQPGPSRVRGAPGPSSDAAWMHPSRSRPPPLRDRAPLQPALLAAPDAEVAGAQAAAPTQRQRLAAALRTDTTDIITLAQTQPGSEDWAHTWTAVHTSVSAGQRGLHHSMAPAAWQALCWGLPQARRQRYSRVSCLPSPWMSGSARQPQPCHAHLSSLPGSVAVVRQHLDSHQPAGATTTPCRPPPLGTDTLHPAFHTRWA